MTTVPLNEENILMLEKVIGFPSQLSRALELVRSDAASFAPIKGRIANVVIMGMGASGVVGDFVRVLMRDSSISVHAEKSSRIPAYANSETLVVCITYSGKTRETLDALNRATALGIRVLVVSSSDELRSICASKGVPCVQIPTNGFPRATLGMLLLAVLGAFQRLGLFRSSEADISEAVEVLEEVRAQCGPQIPEKSNPARLLAHAMFGAFPVIYAQSGFTEVAGIRWKQQLSENAKVHSYLDNFPELLHNEIESWHLPDNGLVRDYALLLLRDSAWEQENGMEGKVEAVKRLAESKGAKVYDLWSRGRSELARLLSLCYVGDFVSVYLALCRGIDPGPVRNIDLMKKVSGSAAKEL